MFKFKRNHKVNNATGFYKVTFKFIDETHTHTTTATASGLAGLVADSGIEILEVIRIY